MSARLSNLQLHRLWSCLNVIVFAPSFLIVPLLLPSQVPRGFPCTSVPLLARTNTSIARFPPGPNRRQPPIVSAAHEQQRHSPMHLP